MFEIVFTSVKGGESSILGVVNSLGRLITSIRR
jgi:hypothetical protein